ncbi:MAG: ABC transporter substrate-binding protein [Spirochaetales bacterium]|nr:ABC transporter substrate-binding protein [Spirochaetales bacterium]
MSRRLILAALILTALLAGCEKKEAEKPAAGPVEISFLHIHGGTAGEVIKNMAADFNAKTPGIHVTPVYVEGSYEGALEKLQALAAVNQIPELTQAGFQYTNYMIENLPVVPAYQFIEKEGMDTSDFFPTMLNLGKYKDGKVYGLPIAVSNPVLYYNKDLFKANGLTEADIPTTFDQLREVAKKLTNADQYGVYFNYSITGNWLFQAMVETFGGDMVSSDLKSVAFDRQPGLEVMTYWNDLVNTDKSMPFVEAAQAIQGFTSGKIGMYVTTTASLRSFQKAADFEVGTAKFPTWKDNPRRIPGGGNNGFVMKSTPEKEKAAWEFLKYITSPVGTTAVASGMGYMAVRQSAVSDPKLMGTYLTVENPPAYTTYTQIPDMTQWNNFPGKGGTRIFKIVQDNIQAVFAQQKTPEQAIREAAADANALIR